MKPKPFTISKARSALYGAAKSLGDVQAVEKSIDTGSLAPIGKRIERRLIGRIASIIISAIFGRRR